MKMLRFLPFGFASLLLLSACKEISPEIGPLGPSSVTGKKVLVEEYTGVQCVNCPQGTTELEGLQALYGDNLVVVSIHAGDFSQPYSDSQYDFRTADGDNLLGYLGAPEGYPAAIVNRSTFSPDPMILVGTSKWANYIAQEIAAESKISLGLNTNFDASTNTLSIDATILPLETITGDHRLTLMISESGIVDKQYTPTGFQPEYVHKHVMREIITDHKGDVIDQDFVIGADISLNYSFVLPENWNPAKCELVAFITNDNGTDRRVIQVEAKHFAE